MPTANEELLDATVRHQIGLMMVSGAIRNRVWKLLDATEADLREQIERRTKTIAARGFDSGPATTARLKVLDEFIKKIRRQAWDGVKKEWIDTVVELAPAEAEFLAAAVQSVSPVVLDLVIPPAAKLRSIARTNPIHGKTLGAWAASIADADLDRITQQVRIGLVLGETPRQLADRVVGAGGVTEITRRNAEALTRTMVNHVSNQARSAVAAENTDIVSLEVYVATLDSRTTPVCRANDGKRFPVGEGPVPPLHVGCFPGDSLVSPGGDITACSHRQYDGEVVIFRTAAGHEVTCTPNHPILTDRGWVAAELLQKGSRVIRRARSKAPFPHVEHEPNARPTSIEEISRTLRKSGQEVRVKGSAADFHGDGSENEVSIVGADSLLPSVENDATLAHKPLEFCFKHLGSRISSAALLICDRLFQAFRERSFFAAHSIMRRCNLGLPLFWGTACPDLKVSGGGDLTLSRPLPSDDRSFPNGPGNTADFEEAVNGSSATADTLRDIFHALAGNVAVDDVLSIRKDKFSGHVYNLETTAGYYFVSAGDVIVHNCRSLRVALIDADLIGDRPEVRAAKSDLAGLSRTERRKKLRAMTGQVPAKTTYQDFLKRQSVAFQDQVLGRTKARLFRDGGLTVDRFVDRRGNELTIAQLRQRERKAFARAGL